MDIKKLDKIIHERVRLAIMSALAARGSLTFTEIKELIRVTDGNLSVNARILEDAGLITMQKEFVGRKPQTTYHITEAGKEQFRRYIEVLEEMIRPGKKEVS